jgi:hypothetical protein
MKTAKKSFGGPYTCLKPWDKEMYVQSGSSGLVLSDNGNYSTAFFEAFPKNPSCFLRGEGKTIEEAEANCWDKYQKVVTCDHEMERRNRTDGYGYCKNCSYASMVFEPLTKCCKCSIPTAYAKDYRGRNYCRKHARCIPNPEKHGKNASLLERMFSRTKTRLPRKYKKLLKMAAEHRFRINGHTAPIEYSYNHSVRIQCGDRVLALLLKIQQKKLINEYLLKKK